MLFMLRILVILGIFGAIEAVDYNVDAINFPWWLSLLMAALLPVSDIITIFIIDWID